MPILEMQNQSYRIDKNMCNYDFYFDKNTNVLHVLDLHEIDTFSVAFVMSTNAMGMIYHLHNQFTNEFNFRMPPNFRLFLYSADKIVYEWKNEEMSNIPIREFEKIHIPYLRKKRAKKIAVLE